MDNNILQETHLDLEDRADEGASAQPTVTDEKTANEQLMVQFEIEEKRIQLT